MLLLKKKDTFKFTYFKQFIDVYSYKNHFT